MAATVRLAQALGASTETDSISRSTSLSLSTGVSVRIAGVSAVTTATYATVRLADVTAESDFVAASVRVADVYAYSATSTTVWNGSAWVVVSSANGVGSSVSQSVSAGFGTSTFSTGSGTSVSASVSRGSGTVTFSGSLSLSGGGTLTPSGAVSGPSDFVGTFAAAGGGTLTIAGNAQSGAPGAGSVTVTASPDADPPQIRLDLAGFLGTTAIITRIDASGNRSPVRTANPATLDAGTWVGYDYEAPFGQAVRYEVAATLTVISDPVTLDVSAAWLIHAGLPDLSMPILVASRGDRTRPANMGTFKVLGRANPLTRSDGVRGSETYDITLRTGSVEERAALTQLLDDSTTLLLQIPADGLYQWVSVGDVVESDVVPYFGSKLKHWTLPLTVTDAPSGLLQAQRTLADLAAEFGTLQEIFDNYATLRDVAVDNLAGT